MAEFWASFFHFSPFSAPSARNLEIREIWRVILRQKPSSYQRLRAKILVWEKFSSRKKEAKKWAKNQRNKTLSRKNDEIEREKCKVFSMQDEENQLFHQLACRGVGIVQSLALGIHLSHLRDDLHHFRRWIVFHSRHIFTSCPRWFHVKPTCHSFLTPFLRTIVRQHQILEIIK